VLDRVADRAEGAAHVDPDDRVPFVDAHVDEHPVADDAGVAHERVEAAPGVECLLDHRAGGVEIAHVVAVDHGFATGGDDRIDHLLGRARVVAVSCERGADVVDDDLGSRRRERQGVGTAQSASGSRDDHHSVIADPHPSLPLLWSVVPPVRSDVASDYQAREAPQSAGSRRNHVERLVDKGSGLCDVALDRRMLLVRPAFGCGAGEHLVESDPPLVVTVGCSAKPVHRDPMMVGFAVVSLPLGRRSSSAGQ
jgi:hypothetical protein